MTTKISTTPSKWLMDTFYPTRAPKRYACWLTGNDIARTPIIEIGNHADMAQAKRSASRELGGGYLHHGIALAEMIGGEWVEVCRKNGNQWYNHF